MSSKLSLRMPEETLWHHLFLKYLIRTMFASRLLSLSVGISCHPVGGSVKLQIVRSRKCNSVMSNVFGSGGSPDVGNNFSHWSWDIARLDFRRISRLLVSSCCNVVDGWTECKTSLRTCVPPSISNSEIQVVKYQYTRSPIDRFHKWRPINYSFVYVLITNRSRSKGTFLLYLVRAYEDTGSN